MGQPLNPNAPIWQPPNVGKRCNIQPPLLHHPIHINNNNEASSMQRANQSNLSSQSTIMDHTSNVPTHALSSSDFLTQLHPGFQQMGEYVLIDCTVVHGGEDVGYLKPFNDAEKRVMYTDPKNAMVPKYIPQSVSETTRKKKMGDNPSRRMKLNSLGSFIYENMRTVYCPSKRVGCKCYGQIYRVQNGKVEGSPMALLFFAKLNPNTNRIYEHENHDAFPNTACVNSKYSA